MWRRRRAALGAVEDLPPVKRGTSHEVGGPDSMGSPLRMIAVAVVALIVVGCGTNDDSSTAPDRTLEPHHSA